jgi:hypothetical protein
MTPSEETPPLRRIDARPDGGGGDRVGDVEESRTDARRPGSGILSRLFPRLDVRISALERKLATAREERDELKRALGERDLQLEPLLERFGESLAGANADLRTSGVAVGDLDVSLRVDVTGSGDGGVSLRLVDPTEEEVDPDRLSTLSFTVGRRGRLRQYGSQRRRTDRREQGGPALRTQTSPTEADATEPVDSTDAPVEESPERPAVPAEVPNVEGLAVGDAEAELRAEGFRPHVQRRKEARPVDTVVEQWPRPLAVTTRGATVVVFVGGEGEEEEEEE